MSKLYEIVGEDGFSVGPTFTSWQAAWDFKSEAEIPGHVRSFDDPTEPETDPFPSNPEPQEMTAKWAREMKRHA